MVIKPSTMRVLVILGICVFGIIIILTAFNVIFQAGSNDAAAGFPATVFKSLKMDMFTKYGLIAFCALALCFFILGYPRSK